VTIFCVKSTLILSELVQNNHQFCIICGTKKGRTTNIFALLFCCCCWIRDTRYGIDKIQDPGPRINIRIRKLDRNTGLSNKEISSPNAMSSSVLLHNRSLFFLCEAVAGLPTDLIAVDAKKMK
jgi:hypothetical protein